MCDALVFISRGNFSARHYSSTSTLLLHGHGLYSACFFLYSIVPPAAPIFTQVLKRHMERLQPRPVPGWLPASKWSTPYIRSTVPHSGVPTTSQIKNNLVLEAKSGTYYDLLLMFNTACQFQNGAAFLSTTRQEQVKCLRLCYSSTPYHPWLPR